MATGLRSITRMSRPITGGVPMEKDIQAAETVLEPQRKRGEEFLSESAKLGQQATESAVGLERAKMQQKGEMLQAGAKAESEYAKAAQGLTEGAEKEIEKYPFPQFKPTQEDATTYAQLGSLVATLGMMLGGGAKASSKAAIASMTGMMQGWQSGRRDLWEREAKAFDKEVQRIKSQHEAIYKNLKTGLEQASRNKEAARQSFEAAAFLSGSNSILASMLRNGKTQQAMNLLQSEYKMLSDLDEKTLNLAQSERNRRSQEEMQRRSEQLAREQIAATRSAAEARAQKADKGLLKPGAEVTQNYLGTNVLFSDMQDIAKDLNDPKIRKMISDNRLEAFASEELGKIGNQIANEALPKELRNFLVKVRNVRNNYYLTISGKAVTGGEAMRNYGVVPQPGDSADVMNDKVNGMLGGVERKINQYQKLYGLPPIDSSALAQFKNEQGQFDVSKLPIQETTAPQPDVTKEQYDKLKKGDVYWYGGKSYTKE